MSNSGSGLPENGTRRDAVLGLLGVVAGVTGVSGGAQAAEPAAAGWRSSHARRRVVGSGFARALRRLQT